MREGNEKRRGGGDEGGLNSGADIHQEPNIFSTAIPRTKLVFLIQSAYVKSNILLKLLVLLEKVIFLVCAMRGRATHVSLRQADLVEYKVHEARRNIK